MLDEQVVGALPRIVSARAPPLPCTSQLTLFCTTGTLPCVNLFVADRKHAMLSVCLFVLWPS